MIIGQGRIGRSKIEKTKPENRSGGVLMKQIRERRKAALDQSKTDPAPPQALSGEPREDDS